MSLCICVCLCVCGVCIVVRELGVLEMVDWLVGVDYQNRRCVEVESRDFWPATSHSGSHELAIITTEPFTMN